MEADIMTQTKAQDETARLITYLFDQHYHPICAYLYRLVDDWELANDLVQETYLRLFQKRSSLAEVQNQRAWVYRIASNVAFDALKRRNQFTWLPWLALRRSQPAQADSAEAIIEQTSIEAALSHLPAKYRAPLLLYSYYGFSTQEISETLGVSVGAVKTRLYRARELFKEVYG